MAFIMAHPYLFAFMVCFVAFCVCSAAETAVQAVIVALKKD